MEALLLTRKNLYNLPYIKPVEVVFRVVLFGHFGEEEVLFLQVVLVDLAAFEHQSCFLKDHVPSFGLNGSEVGLGYFVAVTPRTGTTELKSRAELVRFAIDNGLLKMT